MYGFQLIKFGENDQVLIVVIEHIVSDAVSRSLLLRDVFTLYAQRVTGRDLALSPVLLQYPAYVIPQANSERQWLDRHMSYWTARLAGAQRVHFPSDWSGAVHAGPRWGRVPVRMHRDLKPQLQTRCRSNRTTVALAGFTAYVAATLRWCHAADGVFNYQSDGRTQPEVSDTVGYFASMLYLRISLQENDSLGDLLVRVTEEYCNAYDHADFSYFVSRPEGWDLERSTSFNLIQQVTALNLSALERTDHALTAVHYEHPMLEHLDLGSEPSIMLRETEAEIYGDVHYPTSRFTATGMSRFARYFVAMLTALIEQPDQHVSRVSLG